MVGALTALLDVIKEFGFSAVTIQKAEITHAQVSALFWLNTAAGAVIALAVFLAAPALARFYDQPELVEITRWMAISFALSGPVVQHWALLRRQMRFGALAAIETGSDIAGFAAAIGVALAGGDYWALVAQRLVYGLVGLIAAWWLCRWRPGRPAPAPGLGEMVRFGGSVTGCYLATVFSRSIDQVVIGWLWGPAILGAYERATKLLMVPLNSINGPVYSVGMPALSRLVDQEQRYRALFRQMVQKLAMLTMPVFALMAVTSDWVVQIVFGPQWSSAAPIAMFASLAATYMPVAIAVGQLAYQSQNRTREMLRATFVDSILCIVAILSGLPFGAVGVAAAAAGGSLHPHTCRLLVGNSSGPVRLSDLYSAVPGGGRSHRCGGDRMELAPECPVRRPYRDRRARAGGVGGAVRHHTDAVRLAEQPLRVAGASPASGTPALVLRNGSMKWMPCSTQPIGSTWKTARRAIRAMGIFSGSSRSTITFLARAA